MIRPVRTPFAAPLLAALFMAATLAACDRSTEPQQGDPSDELRSIAHLKSLCRGASWPVTTDLAVRGRIVGNDRFGEFDRMVVVEDATGGISIAVENNETALDFPFGCLVTVRCNGLVLCDYGGKIQLGAEPGAYGAGRIPAGRIGLHLRRAEEQPAEPPHPRQLASFAELGPELVDTYVRFTDIRFAGEGTWCDRNPETLRPLTTEHTLLDAEGRTLTLRCPATARYASEPVPSGTGSLGCVVDLFNGRCSLRPTNYEALFPTPATPPTTYP